MKLSALKDTHNRKSISSGDILKLLEENNSLVLQQTHPTAIAYLVWRLFKQQKNHFVVIVPDETEMEHLQETLNFFFKSGKAQRIDDPLLDTLIQFPNKYSFADLWSGKSMDTAQRMKVFTRCLWNDEPCVIVTSSCALLERTIPRNILESSTIHMKTGDELPNDFENVLKEWGYTEVGLVEEPGDYSRRGDIIDCYIPLYDWPVRLELWGKEVEAIRFFHPVSQRSLGKMDELFIVPASEILLSEENKHFAKETLLADVKHGRLNPVDTPRWLNRIDNGLDIDDERLIGAFYETPGTFLDYIPEGSIFLWVNADLCLEKLDECYETHKKYYSTSTESEEKESVKWIQPVDRWLIKPSELTKNLEQYRHLWCDALKFHHNKSTDQPIVTMGAHDLSGLKEELRLSSPTGRLLDPLVKRLRSWRDDGVRSIVVCRNKIRARRFAELLTDYGLNSYFSESFFDNEYFHSGEVVVMVGNLTAGFCWPSEYIALISEEELFGVSRRRRSKLSVESIAISSFQDLKEGDYVVHVDHGIGIYRGLVHIKTGSQEGDFLLIEYLGEDKLYVPVDKFEKVQKYVGVNEEPPRIDRLGGKHWEKVRNKARKAAERVAEELLRIYALRQVKKGFSFSPPDRLYHEFEAAFPFEETPDQMKAIEEVLSDMMSSRPMDRLICGDVGFGKTEVALRAAFKAVIDGKQVAVLVPTTVLAEQHYRTFTERLQSFPIRVEILSRFKTRAQQKEIIEGIASGSVDIIIGTHRLLQKDIKFRDLGLLIIDEEHRFGVKHKEQLKQLRVSVDVLTLTATPIPRTLHMALSGIRDLSVIETPPEDRKAVKTFVIDFDENVIRSAIMQEIQRGGQVFFVHNHVHSINAMADKIRKLVPEVTVGVAHGQMKERDLEKVMLGFVKGEIDVLVCTTIIESGLDIPNANTIIINRADRFGLAQMYQLRGRVGRAGKQAYAYLIVPGEQLVSTNARKRLKALLDFSDLGSGFRIAMNDLQIRGGGTILGSAQSGHIAAVGYELYLELVQKMVNKLKGEPQDIDYDPEIKIKASAYLPEQFIPDTNQRLVAYKKLASAKDDGEINEIVKEWRDRYGNLPNEAKLLIILAKLRLVMKKLKILRIEEIGKKMWISFVDKIDEANFMDWLKTQNMQTTFHWDGGIVINISNSDLFQRLILLRRTLQSYFERDKS